MPAVVGVPVIAPVDELSESPGGSEPLIIENVYGAFPPVATSAELYATPTCAVPIGQVSESVCIETTMLQLALAVLPFESTTCAVKLYVPAVVGVPVIAPVEALSVKPGGSEPVMIENV
jgi:hypothetical protein